MWSVHTVDQPTVRLLGIKLATLLQIPSLLTPSKQLLCLDGHQLEVFTRSNVKCDIGNIVHLSICVCVCAHMCNYQKSLASKESMDEEEKTQRRAERRREKKKVRRGKIMIR